MSQSFDPLSEERRLRRKYYQTFTDIAEPPATFMGWRWAPIFEKRVEAEKPEKKVAKKVTKKAAPRKNILKRRSHTAIVAEAVFTLALLKKNNFKPISFNLTNPRRQ